MLGLLVFSLTGNVRLEEFTDVTFSAFLSGRFTGTPEGIFHNYHMLSGWSFVLEALQVRFPGVAVYDVYVLLLCFGVFALMSAWLRLSAYSKAAGRGKQAPSAKPLRLDWMLLWALPFVLLPQSTSLAMLGQGLWLMQTALRLHPLERQDHPSSSGLHQGVWYGLGASLFLLRAESALLLVLLLGPMLFAVSANPDATWMQRFRPWWRTLLMLVLCLLFSDAAFDQDDRRYDRMRGFKVSVWDHGLDRSAGALDSSCDSAVYAAFRLGFLGDPAAFSPQAMEAMQVPNSDAYLVHAVKAERWLQRAQHGLFSVWHSIRSLGFAGPGLLVLHVLALWSLTSKSLRRLVLWRQAWLGLLLLLVAIGIKMEARVLGPLLLLNALMLLHLVVGHGTTPKIKTLQRLLWVSLAFAVLHPAVHAYRARVLADSPEAIEAFLGLPFKTDGPNTKSVFNYESAVLLFNTVNGRMTAEAQNQLLALDFGYLSLYGSHARYMEQQLGERSFVGQIEALAQSNAWLASSPERIDLLMAYIHGCYGPIVKAEPVHDARAKTVLHGALVPLYWYRLVWTPNALSDA